MSLSGHSSITSTSLGASLGASLAVAESARANAGAAPSPAPPAGDFLEKAPRQGNTALTPVGGAPSLTGTDAGTLFQAQKLGQERDSKEKNAEGRSTAAGLAGLLSKEEREEVEELQRRDAEVRAHERAHKSAGGPYAGQANYEYVTGPDGRRYAVSGEVSIDASDAGTLEATVAKLETVVRAALAPANPSAQDQAVAQAARQRINEARAELLAEQQKEAEGENEGGTEPDARAAAAGAQAYARTQQSINPQPTSGATTQIDATVLFNLVA